MLRAIEENEMKCAQRLLKQWNVHLGKLISRPIQDNSREFVVQLERLCPYFWKAVCSGQVVKALSTIRALHRSQGLMTSRSFRDLKI